MAIDVLISEGKLTAGKVVSAAMTLLGIGAVDEAIDLLKQSAHLHDYWVDHTLSVALWKSGQVDSSFQLLDDLVQRSPEDWRPLHTRGRLLLFQQNCEEAIVALAQSRALAGSGVTAELLNDEGTAELACGHPKKAIRIFRSALRLQPRFVSALNNLGLAFLPTNKKKAHQYFMEALHCDRNCRPAMHNLAECLFS